jgi:hypothetical protein
MENAENLTPQPQPQTNTEVTTETTPAPPEDLVADDTVERFLLSQGQPQPDTEVARETEPAPPEDLVPDEPVERFLPRKARGELVPLVRFLKSASFREKLIAVALETLCSGDLEITIARDHGLYHGQIGTDLLADWTKEVFAAIGTDGAATPEERVLAAYVAGLSVAG